MIPTKRTAKFFGVALAVFHLIVAPLGAVGGAETHGVDVAKEPPARESPRLTAFPSEARPGDPVTVAFVLPDLDDALREARVVLAAPDGRFLAAAAAFPLGNGADGAPVYCAILAVPTTAPAGSAVLRLERSGEMTAELGIKLSARDFAREDIELNQANTALRTEEDPKKREESAELWRILVSVDPTAAFATGAFRPPVDSTRRTSAFGDRRRYRYSDGSSDSTIHAGIDYGVPRGTQVRAAAAGRVVLARSRIVTGNSVVLEHLPGVFSLYYHLDKLGVVEGQQVAAGQEIGLSGSTGLATGPHLHWEIRVGGEAADGDVFLTRPVLDKDALLSKMGGYTDR